MLILQCRTCSNHIILDGSDWYQVNDSGNLCACIMQLSMSIGSNRYNDGTEIRPIEEIYRSSVKKDHAIFRVGELTELGESFLREWCVNHVPNFSNKKSHPKKSQPSAEDEE
jgi:hypothetical protein